MEPQQQGSDSMRSVPYISFLVLENLFPYFSHPEHMKKNKENMFDCNSEELSNNPHMHSIFLCDFFSFFVK